MIETLITIVILITFGVYFNLSVNLVDKISDTMLFKQLSLWEVISGLSPFKKIVLVLGAPIIIPLGLILLLINLALNLGMRK